MPWLPSTARPRCTWRCWWPACSRTTKSWSPTLTFIAPANAIRYWGRGRSSSMRSRPTGRWTPERRPSVPVRMTARSRRRAARTRRPAAACAPSCRSHILGHPVDMDPLLELARQYGLVVIEDATESPGATLQGAARRAPRRYRLLQLQRQQAHHHRRRRHDRHRQRSDWADAPSYLTTQAKDDPVEYVHDEIGYNYRLTNIQAAMGARSWSSWTSTSPPSGASPPPTSGRSATFPASRACLRRRGPSPRTGCSRCWSTRRLPHREPRPHAASRVGRHPDETALAAASSEPGAQGRDVVGSAVADRLNREALSLPCSVGLSPRGAGARDPRGPVGPRLALPGHSAGGSWASSRTTSPCARWRPRGPPTREALAPREHETCPARSATAARPARPASRCARSCPVRASPRPGGPDRRC